ncbi:MAG TPA: GTP cyclohydrolase I [Thermoanaerobaculia bacterium]|nr:GTP cyclohydrolase I [Thermoanaerobaculia bacterium]
MGAASRLNAGSGEPPAGTNVRRLHRHVPDENPGEFPVARVAAAFRGVLESLELDLSDPNLAGTDRRVARAYEEMLGGLRRPEPDLSTFPNTRGYDQMVSVTDIPFYSICAHHFLPFFGSVDIGYVAGERLVGLSKLARVVDYYARRPQLQEDLTEQVAALLDERLTPAGLIVSIEARHLCMEMRGVSRPGVITTTTAVRGTLKDERLQRQFFARARGVGGVSSIGVGRP